MFHQAKLANIDFLQVKKIVVINSRMMSSELTTSYVKLVFIIIQTISESVV